MSESRTVEACGCDSAYHRALKADDAAWHTLTPCGRQGNLELRTCPRCGSTLGRVDRGQAQRELVQIAARLQDLAADIIDSSGGHDGALWQVAGLDNAAMHIGATIRRLGMSLDEAQADYVRSIGEQARGRTC